MEQPAFFMDLPLPARIRSAFLDGGADFSLSLEDRRRCGAALERHFSASGEPGRPHAWFMPIIFGGVSFARTPPWAVMLAMGIYGYLVEGSPEPKILEPHTLGPGYHAVRLSAASNLRLLARNRGPLRLTEAFLRLDHKVDPRIWVDFYGLAPLRPEVRVVPFTLIPAEDLSGCIAGAVLYEPAQGRLLNPLKEAFLPADLEPFFLETPSPQRLRSHRERLVDILDCPLDILEANLEVGIDLIRTGFREPGHPG